MIFVKYNQSIDSKDFGVVQLFSPEFFGLIFVNFFKITKKNYYFNN